MLKEMPAPTAREESAPADFDVIVVGAGFGGLRALHEARELGLSARLFEAGSDVGGTWYWNRYPGARTDSEAWSYCFFFSKELHDDWDWSDRMPSQRQVQSYMKHVAERFDMYKDMQFNTAIVSAYYDETCRRWTLVTGQGESFTCTYFIAATGILSHSYKPLFKGEDAFKGDCYHTGRWPKEPVDYVGKRVAIVGSGATAVQLLPILAPLAEHVTLFQRTPNYVMPGRNHALEDTHRQALRMNRDNIWNQIRSQVFAFPIDNPDRIFGDFTPDEQERVFEAGWETGGFRYIFETFDDVTTNPHANFAAAEFVRRKIRSIVKNPETAELLCPTYSIAIKRPPVGNFYYEAFNRSNVSLVDVSNEPITELSANGICTATSEYPCDLVIFATGFDVCGALTQIDIRGKDGIELKEKWADGPSTYLGIMVEGFPNMFMISGPQGPLANAPPVIEFAVRWIGQAIQAVGQKSCRSVESTAEAATRWAEALREYFEATLLAEAGEVGSWLVGANIPGRSPRVMFHFGGAGKYFEELESSANGEFGEFVFS